MNLANSIFRPIETDKNEALRPAMYRPHELSHFIAVALAFFSPQHCEIE